jgi:hypothetical protein
LEGGIRVPFLVQWKGRLPAGKAYDHPVISLDILPTALAAAGVQARPEWKLDGTDLLPFLTGKKQDAPHETLCWRFRFPPRQPVRHRWAIRQGEWKLVKNDLEPLALYNLADDIGEKTNLAAAQPERVRAMETAWRRWNAEMKEPLWIDPPPVVLGIHDATAVALATEIQIARTPVLGAHYDRASDLRTIRHCRGGEDGYTTATQGLKRPGQRRLRHLGRLSRQRRVDHQP